MCSALLSGCGSKPAASVQTTAATEAATAAETTAQAVETAAPASTSEGYKVLVKDENGNPLENVTVVLLLWNKG